MRHWRIYGSRTSEQVSNRLLSKYVKRGGSKAGSMHVQLPDPLHNYRAPQNRDRTCRRQVMRSWASPGKMGIGGRKGGFLERGLREKQGRRRPPPLSKRRQGHIMRVARSPRGALSGRGNRSGQKVRKDSAAGFDLHTVLRFVEKDQSNSLGHRITSLSAALMYNHHSHVESKLQYVHTSSRSHGAVEFEEPTIR